MSAFFSDDIAAKLVAIGYGLVGTNIVVSTRAKMLPGVGPYTAIRDTSAPSGLRVHNKVANPYRRPTCLLAVHATLAPVAKSKAWDAFAALTGVRNATVNGSFYLEIEPIQEPFDMGEDEIGRAKFGFNVGSLREF